MLNQTFSFASLLLVCSNLLCSRLFLSHRCSNWGWKLLQTLTHSRFCFVALTCHQSLHICLIVICTCSWLILDLIWGLYSNTDLLSRWKFSIDALNCSSHHFFQATLLRNSFWSLSQFRRLDARAVFRRRVRPSDDRYFQRTLRIRLVVVHSAYWTNVCAKQGWKTGFRATSRLKEKRGVFFKKQLLLRGHHCLAGICWRHCSICEVCTDFSSLLCSPLLRIPAARVRGLRLVLLAFGWDVCHLPSVSRLQVRASRLLMLSWRNSCTPTSLHPASPTSCSCRHVRFKLSLIKIKSYYVPLISPLPAMSPNYLHCQCTRH